LEGSIQKAGDRLRVNAQLIDALKGHHLWAERYDRELKDLFTIQDEITIKILKALEVKLKRGGESAWNTTDNFEAWGHFVKGYHHFDRVTKEDNRQAIEHLEQATKLDPEYAYAWAMLSFSLYYDGVFGWSEAPAESISRAIEIMQMVAERWEGWISNYHLLMSQIYLFRGQYEKSISEAEKSVELYPNASRFRMILAGCLYRGGKPEEAIVHAKKGMRLEPYHPLWFIPNLARPYEMLGRYEEAIALWNSYVERAHKEGLSSFDAHLGLAMDYVKLNRMTEAQNHAAEIIKLNPQYTAEIFRKSFNIKDRTYVKSRANLLIKAGIPEHPPLKLPDKPSIAVLPFDNMSKDPEQEYFADGMTDDLITDLSKISGLFVIARNSTFQYKGKAVDVKKVSRELGIRYVLEGSVRKAGDKVRINAQLIDATTGGHLWAERYDGHMEDIFSLQDKITQKIVTALTVKLTTGEKENIASKGTDNIEAYDAFLKGWQHYLRGTPESFAQAIAEFGKAVELDPDFSRAYAALALVHLKAGSSKEWYEALRTDYFTLRVKARNFLNIALKNPTSLAYRVASSMDLRRRNHDKALLNAEKAIALNPSDAESQFAMAEVLVYIGRPKEAIQIIKSVMKLDPNRMPDCLQLIGIAHFCLEEYEAAIASFNRAMKYNPAFRESSMIASTYGNLGKDNEARAAFEIIKKRYLEVSAKGETATITKLNLQPIVYHQPFINSEVTQRFIDGLIKAGWPEPHRYYEVYKENKLIGDEVRNLVIGKTQVLASFAGGGWKQKFSKDGTVDYKGYEMHDAGVYQLEGDQCCITMKKILAGLPLCSDLYRNPSGTSEKKNEYLQVNDFGIYPVSYVD
jgi:TolB-like protein/Flp pilus assembly protein TadD